MTAQLTLGADSIASVNTGTVGSPTWVVMKTVRDNTLNRTYGDFDTTTRGANGLKTKDPTLTEFSVDCEMLEDLGDAAYAAIDTAFLAKTPLGFKFQGASTTGSKIVILTVCYVFDMPRGEPIDGYVVRKASISPAYGCVATDSVL